MFCPLCKAEYREGVANCKDCDAVLVGLEEATRTHIALLWRGYNQRAFNKIVAALKEVGVPCDAHSRANPDKPTPFFLFHIRALVRSMRDMGWEIYVLERDLAGAQSTLERILSRR